MAIVGAWTRLQGAFVGLAIGRAAGTAFAPVFEGLTQDVWQRHPIRVLNPNQLAQLVANAITTFDAATEDAERQGYNANRLRALVELQLNAPGIGQLQEMRRREEITEEQFRHGLRKMGLEPQYDDAALALIEYLPPPTDLIRFAIREVFNPAQRDFLDLDAEFPEAILPFAQALGISEDNMRRYWAAQWDLPSYSQLSTMLFRGELTPQQFRDSLKALNYAPTWRGKLEAIARAIPTMSDFQRIVRRGAYSDERQIFDLDADYPAVFTDKAALHGMSEADARDLWVAGWRLPSARQLYQMLWRHEITQTELNAGLKALDYPPFWRQKLANIARPKPPRTDLRLLQRYGIITEAEAHEGYMQLGYTSADADREVALARAQATRGTQDAAPWATRARSGLYTVAHREYLSGSLPAGEAVATLDYLGATPAEIDAVISAWDTERGLVQPELTVAQIRRAYKKTEFDRAEAFERLLDRGYSVEDANTLLDTV